MRRLWSEDFDALRALVRPILEEPHAHAWTVQGFGMLRTYVGPDKAYRLNIWHGRLSVPNVSIVHDHPWDFTSWIINGQVVNLRFAEDRDRGSLYDWMTIKTGVGNSFPHGDRGQIWLRGFNADHYQTGDKYHQDASEVHASHPENGAVTLNVRTKRGDGEHARVFWPAGSGWVDAKPRDASLFEIRDYTELALSGWLG